MRTDWLGRQLSIGTPDGGGHPLSYQPFSTIVFIYNNNKVGYSIVRPISSRKLHRGYKLNWYLVYSFKSIPCLKCSLLFGLMLSTTTNCNTCIPRTLCLVIAYYYIAGIINTRNIDVHLLKFVFYTLHFILSTINLYCLIICCFFA